MRTSQAGLDLIKHSEGFRSQAYRDACGLPTIGYGHRLMDPNAYPFGLTEPEAAKILAEDLHNAEQAVARLVKVPLTQGQFDALVDFVFNLGAGRLTTSSMLRLLNAGRYADAAEQMLQWDHAGGRELAALKARRQADFELWHAPAITEQTAA
jgi:lysozyme